MDIKSVVMFLICLAGCCYQIIDISKRFFSFSTRRYVNIYVVEKLPLPGVSICWFIGDIIDYKMLGAIRELEKGFNDLDGWNYFYKVTENITVHEILQATPSNESIIDSCQIRFPDQMSWVRLPINQSECRKYFKVEKYIYRQAICYKFSPKIDPGKNILDMKYVSNTVLYPGIIYNIRLNHKIFDGMKRFTALGHSPESSPLYDSVFSIEQTIDKNKYRIRIMSTPTSVILKPPPYDTDCRNVEGFRTRTEYSLYELNKATMKHMDHVHTLGHVDQPYKYPMFTGHSYRNITIMNIFNKFFRSFSNLDGPVCELKYNIPKTSVSDYGWTAVTALWPQESGTEVTAMPNQDFMDYIIYVCSSASLWLGVCAYSALELTVRLIDKKYFPASNNTAAESVESTQTKIAIAKLKSQHLLLNARFVAMSSEIRDLKGKVDRHRFLLSKLNVE